MTEQYFFEVDGWCPICRSDVRFSAKRQWFRDFLLCSSCGSIPRERALMTVLERFYPGWRELRVHESSPAERGVSPKLARECPSYVATQFDSAAPLGVIHPSNGFRNENLERQTFADQTFDIVITQDVFEHVFHPELAIKEIARTLRPGGAHLGTVPIVRKGEPSRRRASIDESGSVHHHVTPPEFHGNPIDPEGSLVTFDYGYDIAARLSNWSGLVTTMFTIDDLSRGIRAEFIEVMLNQKLDADSQI